MRVQTVVLVALLLLAVPAGSGAQENPGLESAGPSTFADLAAWFHIDLPRNKWLDRKPIPKWTDDSGSRHDLEVENATLAAKLRPFRINGLPVVEMTKGGSYLVREPFELADHTIVLVHRAGLNDRALFSSKRDPARGIVLHESAKYHLYRNGTVGHDPVRYSVALDRSPRFTVTVLGREGDRLFSYVNGVDVSSGERFAAPMVVGRFFAVKYSKQSYRDGEKLEIAEMAIYRRWLDDPEREALTDWLAKKYKLDLVPPVAAPVGADLREDDASPDARMLLLSTSGDDNVNESDGTIVAWGEVERVDAPFRHEADSDPTRIHCTEDATRISLLVSVPIISATEGTSIELAVLKNGDEYLDATASSGAFGGSDEAGRTKLEVQVTTYLDAGDYLEIVLFGVGAPGPAKIVPGEARLAAEAR